MDLMSVAVLLSQKSELICLFHFEVCDLQREFGSSEINLI